MEKTSHDPGLGRIGIWSAELRFGDRSASREMAAELEQLGYGAAWVPGGVGGDILRTVSDLLGATRNLVIATAIINIWKHEPAEIGRWWRELAPTDQARTMLGLGVSHGPIIGAEYRKPIGMMKAFLDGLDADGIPVDRRCIAAFGPQMLALSRDRSAGAHPYLITAEHTAQARALLGPNALLAPGQAVVLETDPALAREMARQGLAPYLNFPNYINSWKRQGFTEDDIKHASDRLCDGLVAWGPMDHIVERVQAHLDAGADHVCVKVIRGPMGGHATELREPWRALAKGTPLNAVAVRLKSDIMKPCRIQ